MDYARLRRSLYRPFCSMHLYFDKEFNDVIGQTPRLFPTSTLPNVAICVMGPGASKDFSAIATNILPDYELISKGQCFPLYLYEKDEQESNLFSKQQKSKLIDGYRRRAPSRIRSSRSSVPPTKRRSRRRTSSTTSTASCTRRNIASALPAT